MDSTETPPEEAEPPSAEPARATPPRQDLPHAIEQAEILQGAKPGTRFARRTRAGARRFIPTDEGRIMRATERATAPRTAAQAAWRQIRRITIGSPISSEQIEEQRLPKTKALAVFSSDALSSSAYATDEVLLVLVAAGAGALTRSIEIAIAIVALMAIVTFSYRQTIRAYPSGGGAYIVARENLGDAAGLTAAAALSVDYVLTVAVSIAAGTLAVTSAFPDLGAYRVELAVSFVGLITLANLRGIRESGTLFAIPTYGFIFAFALLLVAGFVRLAIDPGLRAETPESAHVAGTSALTAFLILRAFASGCTALTGIEAISNGIPAFKKPESQNASTTLIVMAAILGTLFLGVTVLAHELHVVHADDVSAPAQIAQTVFGDSIIFYGIQAFTALILILAANTSYADFPRLGSILARDQFLPHQFTFRGDRLAFSNGIVILGLAASLLLVVFDADINALIPLYAFGVFVSFTLSQGGMIEHWRRLREPGWRRSLAVNLVGALATAIVAVIVGATKFADGAWISMLAMIAIGLLFWAIHSHYSGVERRLSLEPATIVPMGTHERHVVLVPVDNINIATMRTIDYARTISRDVVALHVTDEISQALDFRENWERAVLDVPLVIIDSPYRSFVAPVLSYLDAVDRRGEYVTVVLPEYRTRWPWQRWLHNQSARRLKNALMERPNTVIVEVPFHLGVEEESGASA
jgi:amino acid transporter